MGKVHIYTTNYQTAWLALSRLREYYKMKLEDDGKTLTNDEMTAMFMHEEGSNQVIGVRILSDQYDRDKMEEIADRVAGRKSTVTIF